MPVAPDQALSSAQYEWAVDCTFVGACSEVCPEHVEWAASAQLPLSAAKYMFRKRSPTSRNRELGKRRLQGVDLALHIFRRILGERVDCVKVNELATRIVAVLTCRGITASHIFFQRNQVIEIASLSHYVLDLNQIGL